MISILYDISVA